MNIFYYPGAERGIIELDQAESRHAIKVLRLQKGDPVVIVDGEGGWMDASVEGTARGLCQVRIHSCIEEYQPLSYHLHLGISPTKNMDRFEWFLEKATEIGISEITPLLCSRTERTRINGERLDRILVSSMKQSQRARKPRLHPLTSFHDFINSPEEMTKGIAHCIPDLEGGTADRSWIGEVQAAPSYAFLVGPEGDFTEEEVGSAVGKGYRPYHLGKARLRTETAGMYICTVIRLTNEGLSADRRPG